jgi:hypothetical protein
VKGQKNDDWDAGHDEHWCAGPNALNSFVVSCNIKSGLACNEIAPTAKTALVFARSCAHVTRVIWLTPEQPRATEMTHEYDDPVTTERVEAAVQLVVRLQTDRHAAQLDELVIEAVDAVFCTNITSAADASIRGASPAHAGLVAEVLRRVQAATAASSLPDPVDLASDQSFPASDPPAWISR